MANAKIDDNYIPTLLGITNEATPVITPLRVDPTTGRLLCLASISVSMEEISDVNITGLTDNQILTYDLASEKWINEDPSAGAGDVVGPATNTDLYLPQ